MNITLCGLFLWDNNNLKGKFIVLQIYNVAKRKKALTLSSENCRKDEAEKFYHSAFTENMLTVCLKREEWPASWQPSESLRVSSEQMV